jgi:O-antigen/teichoic acid export membrane protein
LEWAGIFGTVGSAQILIQGLGFLGGLLIVRFLPSQEYALYTLANAMLTTMSLLADGGISTGVMAEGGKVWQDPQKLGSVISTGFSLRRRFAVACIFIAGPILMFLLHAHGASWATAAILFATVTANFWFCVLGSIYNVAPALHQRLAQVQRIAVIQGIARVFGLALTVIAIPTALMALVSTVATQAWASFRLRLATFQLVPPTQTEDPRVKTEVFKVVRRILPNMIYFSVSSQISIWLISICGSTEAVARLGALARLGQVFVIFSAFSTVVFVPRFARLPENKALLLKRYLQTLLLALSGGMACVGMVALFPRAAVWILGSQYQGLAGEVVLQAICSLFWFVAGIAYSLPAARGLIVRPEVGIPLQIFGQVCLIILMNLSTVKGILFMAILLGAWQIVIYLANTTIQIGRLKNAVRVCA